MLRLRLAYLTPAIADFVLAAMTLFRMRAVDDDSLVPRAQFAGAAACWGILLLLGMAKPVQRVWILWPTAIVIACVAAAFVLGYSADVVSLERMVFVVVLSGSMIWLCWSGVTVARDIEHRSISGDGR